MEKDMGIDEIEFRKELYPRQSSFNPEQVSSYAAAMKYGDKFPSVAVAELEGKTVLVDGWIRLGAMKMLKLKIAKVKDLGTMTADEIFLKAVELNRTHGLPLSYYDRLSIARKMLDSGKSIAFVTNILHWSARQLQFELRSRTAFTATGKKIILPASLKQFAGRTIPDGYLDMHIPDVGDSAPEISHQYYLLTTNNALPLEDQKIRDEAIAIHEALSKTLQIEEVE